MTYNVFGGTLDLAQPTNPFDHKRKIGLQRGGGKWEVERGCVFVYRAPATTEAHSTFWHAGYHMASYGNFLCLKSAT